MKFLMALTLFFASQNLLARPSEYQHVDPKKIAPQRALEQALTYLDLHKSEFRNRRYMVVIDFTKHSIKQRFFLVDLVEGSVQKFRTAHGVGSDRDNDGYAERFSNVDGSLASSLGFYRTLDTYFGKNGLSLKLQGLSRTNSNAFERAIVVHGADYVNEGSSSTGRSWGCPAVDNSYHRSLINRIKGGALMYIWKGQ
jgi:hypothetical protein